MRRQELPTQSTYYQNRHSILVGIRQPMFTSFSRRLAQRNHSEHEPTVAI